MIKEVIILGNHIQVLGISRIASRLGYKVMLFNDYSLSVARFSNTCNKFIKYKNNQHLLKLLLANKINKNEALLIPTNDMLVGFVSDNYNVLNELYMLSIATKEITDLAFNKINTYKMALRANVAIPESYFPQSIEELNEIETKLKYPVIIKPAIMFNFFKKSGKKVFLCKSKFELYENYKKALKFINNNELIVQEFLTGGAKSLYSFASYSRKGEVIGSFIAGFILIPLLGIKASIIFAGIINLIIGSWILFVINKKLCKKIIPIILIIFLILAFFGNYNIQTMHSGGFYKTHRPNPEKAVALYCLLFLPF